MSADSPSAVLHYVGYDVDRGGILAVVRALAAEKRFPCVLGVNSGFVARAGNELPLLELPAIAGERIGVASWWRARRVAHAVRGWLREDPRRVFHGHSRAGLLVALWLRRAGEQRVLATVHCYGRQRWFYRWAAGRLRARLCWLSPEMKRYYEGELGAWSDCLPPCTRESLRPPVERDRREVRFACVGGLVPVKRWERVIDALREVPESVPVRVVHAGGEDGSAESARYAASLRARVTAARLASRFEFRGELSTVVTLYQDCHCLLIASEAEAFSVAGLEAAAWHLPCLAADGPGNRDLVSAGRLGWIFQPATAGGLARQLAELAASGAVHGWRRDDAALEPFLAPQAAARHAAKYAELLRHA
jgi:glycosyltransferase involved in cell wall biosynthesis